MKKFLTFLTFFLCCSIGFAQQVSNDIQERLAAWDDYHGEEASITIEEVESEPVTTRIGVTVGFAPNPEEFDLGVIAWFNDIGVAASYIFTDQESLVDWSGRIGIGKRLADKYSLFASAIVADTAGDLDIGYALDVGYDLTNTFGLTIGIESERKVRFGAVVLF